MTRSFPRCTLPPPPFAPGIHSLLSEQIEHAQAGFQPRPSAQQTCVLSAIIDTLLILVDLHYHCKQSIKTNGVAMAIGGGAKGLTSMKSCSDKSSATFESTTIVGTGEISK